MAGSFNRITIVGNLGRDPESKQLPSGDPVADFSIATTERRKEDDVTTWFKVGAFGKLAETCTQYLHKGSYCYVEGTLSQREYIDRDGNLRTSLEVRARDVRFLDRVSDHQGQGSPAPVGAAADNAGSSHLDDLPF